MAIFRNVLLIVVAGLWVVNASPAVATVATASLDWSNFQIFALGVPNQPSPTFSLSLQSTTWNTSANTVSDSSDTHAHSASNWTTSLDITSDTPHANAAASASSTKLSTNAAASDSTNPNPQGPANQATASLGRTANVDVSGPAAVIFSVPYSISLDAPLNDFDHRASAGVTGSASFTPTIGSASDSTSRSFSLDSVFGSTEPQDGTLFFGLVVDGAGVVSVTFSATASASAPDPIPEPSVALGLFAGLLALGAVVRRRMMRG